MILTARATNLRLGWSESAPIYQQAGGKLQSMAFSARSYRSWLYSGGEHHHLTDIPPEAALRAENLLLLAISVTKGNINVRKWHALTSMLAETAFSAGYVQPAIMSALHEATASSNRLQFFRHD